jgi:hypothetical protein
MDSLLEINSAAEREPFKALIEPLKPGANFR